MDLRQNLLLILSEFKLIYWLLFSQKSSENLWFCNDFTRNRIKLIRLTLPNVRSEICGQSLKNIYVFYHKRSSNLFKTWLTVFCWLKKPRNGSKYSIMDRPLSRPNHFKCLKGFFPQISLGPFLNTLFKNVVRSARALSDYQFIVMTNWPRQYWFLNYSHEFCFIWTESVRYI